MSEERAVLHFLHGAASTEVHNKSRRMRLRVAAAKLACLNGERSHTRVALRVVALVVLAVAVFCSIQRIRAGVDFEDEATHLAIPYRFVLGDRPFIDEINPIQTAGFITRPLIWAFVRATGGTDGIVLFTRVVYLLCCIGVAWTAVLWARKYVDPWLAVLCAAPIVVQIPGIPNLGYHTIASLTFTAGVFAVAHGLKREQKSWVLLGGVMHALAAIAIQVYAVSGLLFAIAALVWLAPNRKLRSLAPYALGAVVTAIVFAAPFFDLTRETIEYTYRHSVRDGTWRWKVEWVYYNQIRMIPHKLAFAIALVVLVVAARLRWKLLALPALLALPVLAYQSQGAVGANLYTTVIAMLAPFLWLALRDRAAARVLFLGLWLPSFLAGLGLAWASSVHVMSEGYAQLPACIVTSILAAMLARELFPTHFVWPAVAWSSVLIASFLLFQRQPYNDDEVTRLDVRVADGPWRGIATTRAKMEYLSAIQADVRSFADPEKRVLFFTHFPAGYLMSSMRPAASSVWAITCQPKGWESCVENLERDLDRLGPTALVAFDMQSAFHTVDRILDLNRGAAHDALARRARHVLQTPEYAVYLAP